MSKHKDQKDSYIDVTSQAVSEEYQGRVTFAKLDVDTNETLTNQWNVDGIPTLIFFKNGQEINRIKGIVMRDKLRRQIEGALLAT